MPVPEATPNGHIWAHPLASSTAARRVIYDLFGQHTRGLASPEEIDPRAVALDFCSALFQRYDQFCSPGPRRATKREAATTSLASLVDTQVTRRSRTSAREDAGGAAQ